ncbi:MAG: DUF6714 family protein [Phycisphaerales bacterium]
MEMELSDVERAERDGLIASIHDAFAGVTRGERGISWSECIAIDDHAPDDVCAAARQSEQDSQWSQLVDDQNWQPFSGCGGFSFINAEGFRYYLPPTMIRFLRGDNTEGYPGLLIRVIERFTDGHLRPLWSEAQLRSIACFIAFMARHDDQTLWLPGDLNPWTEALEGQWGRYLPHASP